MAPLFSLAAPASVHRRGRSTDAGFILVGALAKLTLAVAVIGTAGYDAISITSTHLQVQDHAQEAAVIGHDALGNTKSARAAYAAILRYAEDVGETVVPSSFKVGKDRTVTITLTREADTIAAGYLPKLKNYVVATGTGSATDPIR